MAALAPAETARDAPKTNTLLLKSICHTPVSGGGKEIQGTSNSEGNVIYRDEITLLTCPQKSCLQVIIQVFCDFVLLFCVAGSRQRDLLGEDRPVIHQIGI